MYPVDRIMQGSALAVRRKQRIVSSSDRVNVDYEWGKLEEAIVGVSTDVVVAQWHEPYHSTFGSQVNDWYRRYGGQRLDAFDPDLAARMIWQQDQLAQMLKHLGVVVHRVDDLARSKDRTFLTDLGEGMFSFPRDPMLVVGTEVIETSPKHLWRRRERYAIRAVLDHVLPQADQPELQWLSVPPPSSDRPSIEDSPATSGPFLEGGDVLLLGDELLVGRSGYATDERGVNWLKSHLRGRRKVSEVRLTKDAFHLDCALAVPRPGLAVVYPPAFLDPLPGLIRDWDFIEVSGEEQQSMATNFLIVDESRVICDERHTRLTSELEKRGIEVLQIPFDGPAVFGGGLRCSHHPLRRTTS
ncbi:arginine deiminase family protein [Candidatus Nanopelagicales bacterium]|nr:arginine deiminase family protein [Candidatus Nanopelagicales bacterium]